VQPGKQHIEVQYVDYTHVTAVTRQRTNDMGNFIMLKYLRGQNIQLLLRLPNKNISFKYITKIS